MQNTVHIKNLNIGYGEKVIASNIDFALTKGELCAIVGVNGIGKSTLLRTLAKLQPKLSGEILFNDQHLDSHTPSALSKILSVVLTDPIATKNLTAKELVALGRQPYTNWIGMLNKRDKTSISQSIKLFELERLQHKKCFELSDGQLQRVLIARTMAQDTSLILLDEPTTHLDLFHKVQILKLLQKLAHEHHKSILFTTHEIDLAIQLCDKILILDGKTNPFGQPCELIEQGCFESLFPSEMVQFDAKTGSFKITK